MTNNATGSGSTSVADDNTATTIDRADARYTCNIEELNKLRQAAPWKNDALWFKSVEVSPTAIMKMVRPSTMSYLNNEVIYPFNH